MTGLQTLIANGELNRVLEILSGEVPARMETTIILLKSRLNGLNDKINKGIIGNESADIERNRITNSILETVSRLDADLLQRLEEIIKR